MPKTVFGILRTTSEALDIDQIATAVMEEHGFDSSDLELAEGAYFIKIVTHFGG
ncbi:MAG: hypothetical protein WBX25_11325 [Rhodomicrobium sp.]